MTEQHYKLLETVAIAALQAGLIKDFQTAVAVQQSLQAAKLVATATTNLNDNGKQKEISDNAESIGAVKKAG